MGRSWKGFRHRLELAGVKLLVWLPCILPLRISVKLVGLLGCAAFDLFRIRRAVALENLERAFGDRFSPGERVGIARRSYVNFAKTTAEFASLGRLKNKGVHRLIRRNGWEHVERCLAGGKGMIGLSGHFGNWEFLGISFTASHAPVDFLVGEQTNNLVDNLMNGLRMAGGVGIISKGMAAREVFRSLRKNRIVCFLSDQDARRQGVFVDFFGTPASTPRGAAEFAYRMNCPIVFGYTVRRADETHDLYYLPPFFPRPEADREEEIIRLTAAYTKALEECVARNPDHYFWAHRRWKTKPTGAG